MEILQIMEKGQFSNVIEIKLLSASDIGVSFRKDDIIDKASWVLPFYFTPGTASFSKSSQLSAAGTSWGKNLGFSIPGMLQPIDEEKLNKTVAVVVKLSDGRKELMYNNDVFSNAKLVSSIETDTEQTAIKFNVNSLFP